MPVAASRPTADHELVELSREATVALDALLADAVAKVRERVVVAGKPDARLFDREQRATHGLAWLATYVEAVRQLAAYTERMVGAGTLGEIEEHLVRVALGEYLAQIVGGIPMSQGELVRPSDLGLSAAQVAARINRNVEGLIASGNTVERRARLIELMRASHNATVGMCGLDETLESIREEMRKFADSEVIGHAQTWHRTNSYIPLEIIGQMSELGVFGLTIPEAFGGMGLGKESMCVVSEELSRGYIGVGSLGTRSEIAAELILGSGTTEQKEKWLPKIASGEVLPTAVFTEPNTGSDLASIKTRALREGNVYKVYGNKTWITHPVRADLMTLLVRTNPKETGHRGSVHAARRKTARRRQQSVSRQGHERHRDRGARLSRHEGIRDRLRRLRSESGKSCSAASRGWASSSSCRPSNWRAFKPRRAPSASHKPRWNRRSAMRKPACSSAFRS